MKKKRTLPVSYQDVKHVYKCCQFYLVLSFMVIIDFLYYFWNEVIHFYSHEHDHGDWCQYLSNCTPTPPLT